MKIPRLIFPFLALLVCSKVALGADSVTVMFRYDDPSHSYVRAFLPGDFNNWGPNNGGAIDTNATSKMTYDAANGMWRKSYKLAVGSTHYYKMHFHTNVSGSQYLWISDPLNPVNDGDPYYNSKVTIADPMIFETQERTSAGSVTGIRTGIIASHGVAAVTVVIDGDTTDITSSYISAAGVADWTAPSPISGSSEVAIVALDSAGSSTYLEFWKAPPAPAYTVPEWSKHAVWYQIFPERFRNGDPANDPVRSSLENPNSRPVSWRVTSWSADWYSRDAWETQQSSDFYGAVFDRRLGGDIQGVIDKLGYLDSLGVNAIYLNPIFYARSLHKYDERSYVHIDPYFGPDPAGDIALINTETLDSTTWHWTSADTLFLGLVRQAHQRGMHIIIDGVFDHCGVDFPAFADVTAHQQNSAYKDWYIVTHWDNPGTPQNEFQYLGWYGISSLPQFARTPDGTNLAPGPKHHIYQITRRWMAPHGDVSSGIDGWRLDTVPDVPINFWTDWNTLVRAINPDAYTVGEVWYNAGSIVSQGRFSGTMNYNGCAIPEYNFLVTGSETASAFAADATSNFTAYGTDGALANQNLLDSHDTERIGSMVVNAAVSTGFQTINNPRASNLYRVQKPSASQRRVEKLMAFTQMAMPGAPMIYYGDEAGMWGANDPDDRMPMPWPDIAMAPQQRDPRGYPRNPDDANFDSSLAEYYQRIISVRRNSDALQTGSFHLLTANDASRALAFSRSSAGDQSLVFINRSEQAETLVVSTSGVFDASKGVELSGSTEDNASAITALLTNSSLTVILPAVSGAIYRVVPATSADVTVSGGWNIVSLPRIPPSGAWNTVYPDATAGPFEFDGSGYAAAASLAAGTGYWMKFGSTDTVTIKGTEIGDTTIAVREGWNLVGMISNSAFASVVTTTPPGILVSSFFAYHSGYVAADTLLPGKGYWIKTTAAGTITIHGH